jgi:CHAD domain-containing protein
MPITVIVFHARDAPGSPGDTTMQCHLLAPTEWTANSLEEILGRTVEVGPRSTVEVTHLDTFDWRVFRAGAALSLETEGSRRTLQWIPEALASSIVIPVARDVRLVGDLPDGLLKSTLEPVVGIRALLPMGAHHVARWSLRVVDARGDALTRFVLERSTALDGSNTPAGEPITVVRVIDQPGHETAFAEVVEKLRSAGACEVSADQELAAAAAALGRSPGDYSSKLTFSLEPDQRADEALRAILDHLLATLRANVDGVLADLDTEFLHDLRVAMRRARSALAQLKGVLEENATAALKDELEWLGSVTNPCRDLDVCLLEIDEFRLHLGKAAGDLDPLQRMLERDRRRALGMVRRALRSARFSRLIDNWEDLASSPPESGKELPNAARPIVDVASERISKAYRRMVKRGSKLGDEPPPEALHRMRIDGKKLRYLLEFFVSLYEPRTVTQLVKELKKLQDILGGFNDVTVQQARLVEVARELMASGEARAGNLLAMERFAAAMTQRQEEVYQGFAAAFTEFASRRSRRRYDSLFLGGES